MLGGAARIGVLANDTPPAGGSWDVSSLRLEGLRNAEVTVDAADGSPTYTPAPGFVGTDTFTYWVYDNWGTDVRATVTVTAGCTITGTAGVTDIAGTDGDDMICVPDPDDRRAFHVIDAKAGNDIVLGGDGNDTLRGNLGDDTLWGDTGNDALFGGTGDDILTGGNGTDYTGGGSHTDACDGEVSARCEA